MTRWRRVSRRNGAGWPRNRAVPAWYHGAKCSTKPGGRYAHGQRVALCRRNARLHVCNDRRERRRSDAEGRSAREGEAQHQGDDAGPDEEGQGRHQGEAAGLAQSEPRGTGPGVLAALTPPRVTPHLFAFAPFGKAGDMRKLVSLGVCLLVVSTSHRADAQNVPPPSQAQAALQQALQQNPGLGDVIRQRIQQSGLTGEQIRGRLQAGGYPANLLDAYLGAAAAGQPAPVPGASQLAAIQEIGLPAVASAGEILPVDTGIVRSSSGPSSAVFGVDVFRRTTTQFLPLLSGPVPADYKLGPGDVLVLILTGDVELAYTLQVTREGFILIPQVGQVFVSNLTLDQLRDVLYTRLGRVYSGVKRAASASTRFDISVANVRANQVYVVGEVAQPGAYQISSLGTVLTGLYAAGGVTERADMRSVEVRRAGKPLATLDLYDYLLHGDTRNDIRLQTGDVVFVPVHGTRVQVSGAVTRPAIYDLKPGETLPDLVQAAGGFRADAALKRVSVYRILPAAERGSSPSGRVVMDVPLATERRDGASKSGDPPSGGAGPRVSPEAGDW